MQNLRISGLQADMRIVRPTSKMILLQKLARCVHDTRKSGYKNKEEADNVKQGRC
jgi:hypothetical protein